MMDARILLIFAIDQIAPAACRAMPAASTEKTDSDALTDRPAFDIRSDRIDYADSFVARHARPLNRKRTFYRRCIGMTDTAGLHVNPNLSVSRIDKELLD